MLSKKGIAIAVASGKGGTGKTTVAVSLASAIKGSAYIDCDVEEPDGEIFLNPAIGGTQDSVKLIPRIDSSLCTRCGKCASECRFNALINIGSEIILLEKLCHSCGLCSYICPVGAIHEIPLTVGKVRRGIADSGGIYFTDGILDIGQEMATPVIKDVKNTIDRDIFSIIDCPPGTSCLMVESVMDSDFVILVTESTPFGLHDLRLAIGVLREIKLPFGVIINKYDEGFPELENYLQHEHITVLLRIPFDKQIARRYSYGKLPGLFSETVRQEFRGVFTQILQLLKQV